MFNKGAKVFSAVACLAVSLFIGSAAGAQGAPKEMKLRDLSGVRPAVTRQAAAQDDILLVMPNAAADRDETFDALKEAHGTIVGTIGEGSLTCLMIKTEKGKMAEVEKKLAHDGHFTSVQRNYLGEAQVTTAQAAGPNDPYYPSEWHMSALNVVPAWQLSTGSGVTIAVGDSGCQSTNPDLANKLYAGADVVKGQGAGNYDYHVNGSHGTCVATCAAAVTNNGKLTAAPAYNAYVYPIRLSGDDGNGGMTTSDSQVCAAIYAAGKAGVRILNISYANSNTNYSFANAKVHPSIHQYLKWYHDQMNGLTFFAAGNDKSFDPSPRLPYMIMVSALGENYSLASFSNYGNCIWFTAPGSRIVCSDRNSRLVSVNGTSFASPLTASVAAMVLAKNPRLTNLQVEQILINSCRNVAGSKWNQQFGYGMPDAYAAVNMVR